MSQTYNGDWEAQDIRALIDGCKGNGIVSGLAVSESSPTAMSVLVASGTCEVDDTSYTEVSGQNLSISNGDATHPRKDIIVYDTTAGNPAVVEGTPAAAPVAPDIPADDIYLAMVHVAANESTSIVNADIDEGRVYTNVKVQGIETGADVSADNQPQAHATSHLNGGGDDIEYYTTDGTDEVLSDTTPFNTGSTSYVKAVEKTLVSPANNLKISFTIHSSTSTTISGKLYKNGTPISSVIYAGSAPVTTTATYSGLVATDKIQVYIKSSGGPTAYYDGLKIIGEVVKLSKEPTWT